MSLKIGFFGSPSVSATLLGAFLDANYDIQFVVSNPDRPRGRSKKLIPSEVSRTALERSLPLYRFETLKDKQSLEILKQYNCDVFLVFAYGKLLPDEIINMPGIASINLHASLLPELRGASPVQSAILQGLTVTGWTLQIITKELDAGDILSSNSVQILPDETSGELMERMLPSGIELTRSLLDNLPESIKNRIKQNDEMASHCRKITTQMSWIQWKDDAEKIHNVIRAFNPSPVARSYFRNKIIRLLHSQIPQKSDLDELEKQLKGKEPGQLMVLKGQKKIFVKTGKGVIEITELQPENKKPVDASSFLNGYRISEEDRFESELIH